MTLTAEELQWINKRMEWYDIKYQEIYDEILDHLLSGVEAIRADGDHRSIDIVFHKVVDSSFGGYLGIDNIVTAHEKAYRSRIGKTMLANYKYYLNWQSLLFLFVLIIAGFYLPRNKLTSLMLICGLLITTAVPTVYAYVKARNIKTNKGKKSMVKGFVLMRSNLMLFMLMSLLDLMPITLEQWPSVRSNFYQPLVYMVFLFVFIIYGLSVIRLCKQEFKIAD